MALVSARGGRALRPPEERVRLVHPDLARQGVAAVRRAGRRSRREYGCRNGCATRRRRCAAGFATLAATAATSRWLSASERSCAPCGGGRGATRPRRQPRRGRAPRGAVRVRADAPRARRARAGVRLARRGRGGGRRAERPPGDGRGLRVLADARAPPRAAPVEPITLSLADRFASMVEQGRRIASALTPDDVHAALCEAASVLLRGQASLVLAAGDGGIRVLAERGGPVEFSRSLVERAIRESRPVVLTELLGEPLPDSVLLPSPRSALCAPIVGGEASRGMSLRRRTPWSAISSAKRRSSSPGTSRRSPARRSRRRRRSRRSRSCRARSSRRTPSSTRTCAGCAKRRRRLVQAAKMATVGTLVAGLSHEINNPLSVILGYAHGTLQAHGRRRPGAAGGARHPASGASAASIWSARSWTSRTSAPSSSRRPRSTIWSRRVASLASLRMRRHG